MDHAIIINVKHSNELKHNYGMFFLTKTMQVHKDKFKEIV